MYALKKWKDTIRRYRYYSGNSFLALIINMVFLELFLFVIGYLWFVQRTKIPVLALFLTLTILSLVTAALVLRHYQSYQKKKAEARRRAGREFLASELRKLNSDEFKLQIMNLLMQLSSIADVKTSSEFLEAFIKGKRTAIGCCRLEPEEEVSAKQIRDFINLARMEGYSQAVFITSGKYSDKCRELEQKSNTSESFQLQLMDMEEVLDRMEEAGIFPDEKTIDALIDKQIISWKSKFSLLKKTALAPKRIRTYTVYSILFFILSRIFRYMSTYYLFASAAFLILALITGFNKYRHVEKAGSQKQLL